MLQRPIKLIIVTTKAVAVDKIIATPVITVISNEIPNAGDSVYVYGTYLKSLQTLTFAGTAITSYKSSKTEKLCWFCFANALSQSGPVSVTTEFGTGYYRLQW
jgi:energy-converting hydrogenase Eha subunit E